jgi:hypothetical protein
MKGRVLIYLLIVAVLMGVGFAVSRVLMDGDEVDSKPDEPSVATSEPEVIGDHDDGNRDAGADQEISGTVEVVDIKGRVNRGTNGQWVEMVAGQTLSVDDAVRTEKGSSVSLKVGESSVVELAQEAEIKVRELSSSVQRLGLVRGRASVDYDEGGERVLRVENEDGKAVAEVRAGKFSIMSTGGTVAVATETGSVDLSASGQKVEVAAGMQSVVVGGAPSSPLAIPVNVLLRVVDPGCITQREPFYTIKGRTTPGSSVRINDVSGDVKSDGRFIVRVPLRPGKNRIVVVTEDVTGREKRRVFPCVTHDPRAGIKGIDINWGTPKKTDDT